MRQQVAGAAQLWAQRQQGDMQAAGDDSTEPDPPGWRSARWLLHHDCFRWTGTGQLSLRCRSAQCAAGRTGAA
jgi:hypothetical protein